jgi:hypothetical protein
VNWCAFERQTSFKAVQGVTMNSSFVITVGKTLAVQQGMERVVDSECKLSELSVIVKQHQ